MTQPAQPRPVFIAALPREIASAVQGWRKEALSARNIHVYSNNEAIIACAGMGGHRASLAVEAALALGPASELISIGWAGACTAGLRAGDIVHVDVVVDAQTGERFFTAGAEEKQKPVFLVALVTAAVPAGAREKQRLGASYNASAVDMEAAAVARIARARELPFYAIKAISDGYDFELPGMTEFTTQDGQFRETAFGLHVALHPSLWKSVASLAKGSTLAAQRLRPQIEAHIQHYRERPS
jgi:adenosylhomocysteine nucleosidase